MRNSRLKPNPVRARLKRPRQEHISSDNHSERIGGAKPEEQSAASIERENERNVAPDAYLRQTRCRKGVKRLRPSMLKRPRHHADRTRLQR